MTGTFARAIGFITEGIPKQHCISTNAVTVCPAISLEKRNEPQHKATEKGFEGTVGMHERLQGLISKPCLDFIPSYPLKSITYLLHYYIDVGSPISVATRKVCSGLLAVDVSPAGIRELSDCVAKFFFSFAFTCFGRKINLPKE
jgi:hypothetical protein